MVRRTLANDADADVDEVIARRVEHEMTKNKWSYGELATRMADHGCAISKAALHRVVNGNPGGLTRGLSAREAFAFADVLGVEPSDLLTPVELIEKKRAHELIRNLDESDAALWHAALRLYEVHMELRELLKTDPELHQYIDNHIGAARTNNPLPANLGVVVQLPSAVTDRLTEATLAMVGITVRRAPARSRRSAKTKGEA